MIPCAICNQTFSTFSKLKSHMAFYHTSVTSFSCASTNCFRTFQIFSSFRRHYLRCHSVLSDSIQSRLTNRKIIVNNPPPLDEVDVPNSMNTENLTIPLDDSLAKLVSCLYANPQVPQSVVDTVFDGIKNMLDNSLLPLLDKQSSNLLQKSVDLTFSNLGSNYKRLKYFKNHGSFIEPEAYTVGTRYEFVKSGGTRLYKAVECKAHYIPLRSVLHKFFSLPNMLRETLLYMNDLATHDSTQTIQHFMHGSFWKSRQALYSNKVLIPLFLQVDDFEPLNALGSHSSIHKLGAAYISLPCLPHRYQSQLSSILLALLYHSSDRVEFGNRVIFQPLIDELNFLSKEGITFDLPDYKGTIFFPLGLILGDNLGLHSITGFVESFSSNYPCRTCKVSKQVMVQHFQEDKAILRNMDNYKEDLRMNNVSLTGVKEECIWQRVENFSLFSQVGVDVMHDLNEGVIKYIMSEIIVAFVDKVKYFSIQLVNNKLASFDYGPDSADIPVSLSMENLRKGNLRLSSSEVATLCRYFGIMFGDLVPRHDKYWALYVHLMHLIDVVMCSAFRPEITTYLQYLISTICDMYTSLFNQTIKPKFHNLVHYHSAMLKFGPLRYLSSMRFEAKHRPNKLASKSSLNRINMTFSIAKRHQLMLNDIFMNNKLKSHIILGIKINITTQETSVLAQEFGWDNVEKIKSVSWVSISSARYHKDCVIVYHIEPHSVHFATILKVYVYNESNIVFKVLPMQTNTFDEHVFAYNIQDAPPNEESIYIKYDSMQYTWPCNLVIVGHGVQPLKYVILRKPL